MGGISHGTVSLGWNPQSCRHQHCVPAQVPVCPGDLGSCAACTLWDLLAVLNADLKSQEYWMWAVPAQLTPSLATTEVKCTLNSSPAQECWVLTRPGFSCQLLKLFFFPQFTVWSELVQTVVGSSSLPWQSTGSFKHSGTAQHQGWKRDDFQISYHGSVGSKAEGLWRCALLVHFVQFDFFPFWLFSSQKK